MSEKKPVGMYVADYDPRDAAPMYGAGDRTESIRREMLATGQPQADLAKAQQRWDTQQLAAEFNVVGFMAPFVVVVRKSDGVKGSMEFTHNPRFYFNFVAD